MYRNNKLRDSARNEACVACGADNGTTVWCHADSQKYGKGYGLKSHDLFGFFGCDRCHDFYGSSKGMERQERDEWFIEQFIKSMIIACEKGYL